MIQYNDYELVVHYLWTSVFGRSVAPVTEHRSLHFVWLHVIAQNKFPLQYKFHEHVMWLLSINFTLKWKSCVKSAEGFLFICFVLCTQIDMFFVKTPDEFTEQCLMLWVRTEHTNLGRLRSSFWCVSESSETAYETQLCNSSRHQLSCICWSQLWNLGNAGCRLGYKDVCATVRVDLVASFVCSQEWAEVIWMPGVID